MNPTEQDTHNGMTGYYPVSILSYATVRQANVAHISLSSSSSRPL